MAIEFVVPEFYNYIRQSDKPIAIGIIEGRYLFVYFVQLTETDATFFPQVGSTFNLLNGKKLQGFQNFIGAMIYDIHYKKWGRYADNAQEVE